MINHNHSYLVEDFGKLVQCADSIEASLMSWSDTLLAARHPGSSHSPSEGGAFSRDERVRDPPKDIWITKLWIHYLMARILVRAPIWRAATQVLNASASLEADAQAFVLYQLSQSAETLQEVVNEMLAAVSGISANSRKDGAPSEPEVHPLSCFATLTQTQLSALSTCSTRCSSRNPSP